MDKILSNINIIIIIIIAISIITILDLRENALFAENSSSKKFKYIDKTEFTGTPDMSNNFFKNLSITVQEMTLQSK